MEGNGQHLYVLEAFSPPHRRWIRESKHPLAARLRAVCVHLADHEPINLGHPMSEAAKHAAALLSGYGFQGDDICREKWLAVYLASLSHNDARDAGRLDLSRYSDELKDAWWDYASVLDAVLTADDVNKRGLAAFTEGAQHLYNLATSSSDNEEVVRAACTALRASVASIHDKLTPGQSERLQETRAATAWFRAVVGI